MPTFDGKPALIGAKTKVDEEGALHVIVVHEHVRDDESKVYEPKCFCGQLFAFGFDSEEEAREAGRTHTESIQPAPRPSTYTSIIRGALGIRR